MKKRAIPLFLILILLSTSQTDAQQKGDITIPDATHAQILFMTDGSKLIDFVYNF
jgi:hypothetical protein